jgi:hypothetical protein
MTDLIHHEPQSFRQLNEAGLPDAFLKAIEVCVVVVGGSVWVGAVAMDVHGCAALCVLGGGG